MISIIIINIFLLITITKAVAPSDLVISKIQITGGTGKTSEDFISIYNKTNSAIDLNGLRLVKRTKTGTTDTTLKSWVSSTLLNPNTYYTWACSANDFATSINADTSSTQTISDDNGVALRTGAENTGTIIDSVGWGATSNAFVEGSPYSTNPGANEHLERINNSDTNNNSLDFQIIKPITPPICGNSIIETGETCDDGNIISNDGCSSTCQAEVSQAICGNNILETGEACDDGNITSLDGCSNLCQIENPTSILGDVRINELVSDPDTGYEWIELYNTTNKDVNLNNWTIEDGSGTKTILDTTINKFYVLDKPKGALNNSGDIVILKNSDGDIIDSITYGDWDDGDVNDNALAANKTYSLARIHDGESTDNDSTDFKVTTTITKGLANIITEPIINDDNSPDSITEPGYDYSQDIIISEIFPNPLGLDSEAQNGEFIELYNKGEKNVLLNGWRLEIGDLVMEIPLNTTIYANQYLTLNTKNILPLPNDGATIKLFQPLRQTSYQSVTYKKSLENQSYANFLTSGWQWTNQPTPGAANFLRQNPVASFDLIDDPIAEEILRFDSSDSFLDNQTALYSWNFGDGQTSALANPTHVFAKNGKYTITLNIKTNYGSNTISKKINVLKNTADDTEINQAENTIASVNENNTVAVRAGLKPAPTKAPTTANSLITITGTAVVAPNIFGVQYFYLLPDQGEPLYEIYNSKKLFPNIKIGDQLKITGTYSEKPEGPQLKTKEASDIKIIGQTDPVRAGLKPAPTTSSDLKNAPYPRLALIQGEITSKKSPRLYLTDSTGDSEIYISSKTKISLSNFSVGEKVSVLGVLTLANGQPRLQPRSESDITKLDQKDFTVASTTETSTNKIELNQTTKNHLSTKQIIFLYCLGGAFIIIGLLAYLLRKK